jgi:hypothetical protein
MQSTKTHQLDGHSKRVLYALMFQHAFRPQMSLTTMTATTMPLPAFTATSAATTSWKIIGGFFLLNC